MFKNNHSSVLMVTHDHFVVEKAECDFKINVLIVLFMIKNKIVITSQFLYIYIAYFRN